MNIDFQKQEEKDHLCQMVVLFWPIWSIAIILVGYLFYISA